MNKFLKVVVLSLLLSSNVYASCTDFLDFSWKYIGEDRITHVKKESIFIFNRFRATSSQYNRYYIFFIFDCSQFFHKI